MLEHLDHAEADISTITYALWLVSAMACNSGNLQQVQFGNLALCKAGIVFGINFVPLLSMYVFCLTFTRSCLEQIGHITLSCVQPSLHQKDRVNDFLRSLPALILAFLLCQNEHTTQKCYLAFYIYCLGGCLFKLNPFLNGNSLVVFSQYTLTSAAQDTFVVPTVNFAFTCFVFFWMSSYVF